MWNYVTNAELIGAIKEATLDTEKAVPTATNSMADNGSVGSDNVITLAGVRKLHLQLHAQWLIEHGA